MLLTGKLAQDWIKEDLLALVDAPEQGRSLEFKRELHLSTREQRQEFLTDVTSFANAAGGHIVYGVAEKGGRASGVPGFCPEESMDALLQRMENLVRDGVAPRLPGFTVQPPIQMEADRWVLIVEVPKSWAAPHAVKGSRNALRFYTRNSAGKQPLDVSELRSAFLLSDSLAQRIRSFHIQRLARIQAGEAPVPVPDTPKAVLHIIPLLSFQPGAAIPVAEAFRAVSAQGFPGGGSQDARLNLDGVLSYQVVQLEDRQPLAGQYRQLFRSGAVEAVHTQLAYESPRHGKILSPEATEEWLICSCTMLLPLLQALGQEPPILIIPSFLGFTGYTIPWDERHGFPMPRRPIDRQLVDIPEVLLESYLAPRELLDVLRPALDTLWNASGHLQWPGYEAWSRRLQRGR